MEPFESRTQVLLEAARIAVAVTPGVVVKTMGSTSDGSLSSATLAGVPRASWP
jgi:hypothetical protein